MVSKENKKTIIEMRKANKSYDYIASQLGLTKSAVQNVCRQAGLAGKKAKQRKRCKHCGTLLPEDAPKRKIFCCQKCREDWWNKHQHLVHKRNPVITYCRPAAAHRELPELSEAILQFPLLPYGQIWSRQIRKFEVIPTSNLLDNRPFQSDI